MTVTRPAVKYTLKPVFFRTLGSVRGLKSILSISEESGVRYYNAYNALNGRTAPRLETIIRLMLAVGLPPEKIADIKLGEFLNLEIGPHAGHAD